MVILIIGRENEKKKEKEEKNCKFANLKNIVAKYFQEMIKKKSNKDN
jgi:hypothetical protein